MGAPTNRTDVTQSVRYRSPPDGLARMADLLRSWQSARRPVGALTFPRRQHNHAPRGRPTTKRIGGGSDACPVGDRGARAWTRFLSGAVLGARPTPDAATALIRAPVRTWKSALHAHRRMVPRESESSWALEVRLAARSIATSPTDTARQSDDREDQQCAGRDDPPRAGQRGAGSRNGYGHWCAAHAVTTRGPVRAAATLSDDTMRFRCGQL